MKELLGSTIFFEKFLRLGMTTFLYLPGRFSDPAHVETKLHLSKYCRGAANEKNHFHFATTNITIASAHILGSIFFLSHVKSLCMKLQDKFGSCG